MKKIKQLLLLALAGMIFVSSCAVLGEEPAGMDAADVNPTLLIGTWKNNSDVNDFKQYTQTAAADGNKEGFAWYAGETIKGQDGTQFYYKVEGNKIYEQEDFMAGTFPRVYTLMSLTKSQLQYFDQFDEIFTFTKQ